jgi:hypothetical protein
VPRAIPCIAGGESDLLRRPAGRASAAAAAAAAAAACPAAVRAAAARAPPALLLRVLPLLLLGLRPAPPHLLQAHAVHQLQPVEIVVERPRAALVILAARRAARAAAAAAAAGGQQARAGGVGERGGVRQRGRLLVASGVQLLQVRPAAAGRARM